MNKSNITSGKRWLLAGVLGLFSLASSVTLAASSGIDNAGNYTVSTFTNNSNGGTGFGPWQFNVGAGASVGLFTSITNTGDIDSPNDLSFRFYGGVGETYGEATRDFNAPLAAGDVFKVTFAYNWNGGNRGVNVLNGSGAELFNINYGGADTLSFNFAGQGATVVRTDYVSTATVFVVVQQLAGNQLQVTLTRNDGYTTNFTSTTLSTPAAKVKFYNGGHAGNSANYALFVNDLEIIASVSPSLSLSGHDAMAAGMTNLITIARGGNNTNSVAITLTSSDPAIASVPASVTFDAGVFVTNFPIVGHGLGLVTILATNVAYPGAMLDVQVYDLAYDDSSYYPPGVFEDIGNGGLGFQPWIIQNNNGVGEGFTNYAGSFIGNSTFGGSDVNVDGSAFGLYANGEGNGNPFVNAIRPLSAELAVGEAISFELGINFRDGAKGAALQNGGSGIFEVAAFADDYWYKIGNAAPVSLGWEFASDTAIEVVVKRVAPSYYDITIARRGSVPELNALGVVELGAVPPNEVRFFNVSNPGFDQNNIYFNRLAHFSGVEELNVLSLIGNDGMVVDHTNDLVVTRSGSTLDPLTVTFVSSAAEVATVSASVVILAGQSSATASVVAVASGDTLIAASADDAIGADFAVEVVDIAYDDTTYYPPAMFDNAGNGGVGFQAWVITANPGEFEDYTNFVGATFGDSASGSGDINSSRGNAFALYANGTGTGANDPLAEATRAFDAELGIGESVSVALGVNYRDGAKGVMFQNGGTWLFEFAVYNDDYVYNVRSAGDNPVSLGWDYAADSAITVILSRIDTSTYNVKITRTGSSPEELTISNITLSQAPNTTRFYVYKTGGGGNENNLFVNRLAIYTGTVEGEPVTDGIPNAWWSQWNIDEVDRIAANDLDGDGQSNWEEYIADTNPDDDTSIYGAVTRISGGSVITLQTGPTTNSRVYDIYWTTNLFIHPSQWNALGSPIPGNNGTLSLPVNSDVPVRHYRTGVALP